MIEVKKINFQYGDRSIYEDLSFNIEDAEPNCIIGKNGVGKSTILDILSGLIKPDSGEIMPKPNSKNVVYQMQGIPMLMDVTGQDILNIFHRMNPEKQRIDNSLDDIYNESIDRLMGEKYRNMSGGERRLVIIYAVCTLKRSIYLFDEPTSGLDPISSRKVLKLLVALSKENQVVFTSHNLFELQQLNCHVVFIANKKCIFQGNYDSLMRRYSDDDPVQTFIDALNQERVRNVDNA